MKRVLLLAVFLVLIAGCSANGKKGTLPDTSAAYTGTEGLSIKFLDNAPTAMVAANTYLPVGLFLENKGAVDISNGVIVIRYPKDMMQLDKDSFSFNLEGKETLQSGGKTIEIVNGFTKNPVKIGTEKPKLSITATGCYDYATKLSTGLCINPDPYGVKKLSGKKAACEAKQLTFNGQGAPVAITKVEPMTLTKGSAIDIHVKAYLENRNKGIIYRKGTTYCTSEPAGINSVFVRASLLGRDTACYPEELVLSDRSDENYVTCSFTGITVEDAFVTQLSVTAEYGYSSTASKDAIIESTIGKCEKCEGNTYIGPSGGENCQSFGDKSYLVMLHEKCENGCKVQYPDFTQRPPVEC